jgi:hypothetical protein
MPCPIDIPRLVIAAYRIAEETRRVVDLGSKKLALACGTAFNLRHFGVRTQTNLTPGVAPHANSPANVPSPLNLQRVFAAVLKICSFMNGEEVHDTRPQPCWCIQRY